MRQHQPNQTGFTLLEILVALLIFGVVGLMSSQLLGRTVDAYEVLDDRGQRMAQIHRAVTVIERDMLQYRDRPIRTESDQPTPALMIGDEGALSMTRGGWRNPLQRPRSEVQRIGYRLQGENLVRAYWPVLDRRDDEEPITQIVLAGVDDLEFFAIDQSGQEHKLWPPKAKELPIELMGIVLRISMPPIGIVERVWEVPNGSS